jgi:hypothetical protein
MVYVNLTHRDRATGISVDSDSRNLQSKVRTIELHFDSWGKCRQSERVLTLTGMAGMECLAPCCGKIAEELDKPKASRSILGMVVTAKSAR